MNTKDAVLKLLQSNSGCYISGEAISTSLGLSRAAIWKAIKVLQSEGFLIDGVRNKGYMLVSADDDLCEDRIRLALPTVLQNINLSLFDTTDSTNLRAKQLASDLDASKQLSRSRKHKASLSGVEDLSLNDLCAMCPGVVIARQQTAGRGRLGRSFFSPHDGIYMSIIIQPNFDMRFSGLVTVAAASAVATAIEEVCGLESRIKWVNDIYINRKKVCGILTEAISDFESGQIDKLIIGIGINSSSASFPSELRDIAGLVEGDYSRAELVAKVISNTLEYLQQLACISSAASANSAVFSSKEDLGSDLLSPLAFLDVYRKHDLLLGKDIKVYKGIYRTNPADELDGAQALALGIDDMGGLVVRYEDGSVETLRSGEVSIRLEQ